ncbi:hypothetical protein GOP47_0021010 [Adiantum capillus-veneris]|uniref:DNA gyrase subunit B n=1 Tax=Adiantum capillus-veneris TaxID=13818 RepID=A0A9D4UAI2_ADICA|nr:hypothetical protein GOP47_0021010 [Adiantum capillus-veneris]
MAAGAAVRCLPSSPAHYRPHRSAATLLVAMASCGSRRFFTIAFQRARRPPRPFRHTRFLLSDPRTSQSLSRRFLNGKSEVLSRGFVTASLALEVPATDAASSAYDAEQIQVLEGLDPVRKRPGMYIGSTGSRGLHHLVFEVLDNAIDEAQAEFASHIDVVLYEDGSVCITDDGRGIPTDLHPVTKKSALETVLTVLHAGGKFGGEHSGYNVSGGLHGVGVSVVNALSEKLEVTVWRNGSEYFQAYERGRPVSKVTQKPLSSEESSRTGTRVKFWPDKEVFVSTTVFDYQIIAGRVRELAFLNPQVAIRLKQEDENPDKARENFYRFAGGLVEYIGWLNKDKKSLNEPISFRKEKDNMTVEAVLQWCADAYTDTILGYANSIRTSDGGTHLDGAKAAITRSLNTLGRKTKIIKEKDENLSGEHAREGLTCIVAVKVPNPEFEGQTKTRLGNPEVRKMVEQTMQENLTEYLECHPGELEAILAKSIQALKAAMAAKNARELVRRKSILKSSTLPGKLADCSCNNPRDAEIFIVEGDSAGGSAKQGRDRHFQAILPLRGKILNIERKDEASLYKNTEIQSLITGLGLGMKGEDFRKEALRYHKIIILSDADVDGAHIRTLLLTFFFRYQKALFEEGCIYVGVPPLYKVERGRHIHYCYSENDLERLKKGFPANASYNIQRFKGLGEMMPLQLWETTMDPARRLLKQLTIEDAAEASLIFTSLMGDKVDTRKELILNFASRVNLQSLDL